MGWCSGTHIFDPVIESILKNNHYGLIDHKGIEEIILVLIKALEGQDWDCHQDSMFYSHPIVQDCLKLVHPEWFKDTP